MKREESSLNGMKNRLELMKSSDSVHLCFHVLKQSMIIVHDENRP
jgi:hypothetical protein